MKVPSFMKPVFKLFRRQSEAISAYLFLIPVLIFFLGLHYYPIVFALFVSFNEYDLLTGAFSFAAFDNYIEILTEPIQLRAMLNTFIYVIGVVTGGTLVGLLVAIALDRLGSFSILHRTIFFMPMVVSLVAISQLWMWIYDRDTGILNFVITTIGFNKIGWLTDPKFALGSIIIMNVWRTMGFSMVIFMAGLKAIPEYFYEAAQADGASRIQVTKMITIPLLVPIILLAVVVNTIGAFKVFTQVYIMSSGVIHKGGPMNSTLTIVLQIYQLSFLDFRLGVGQAFAFILAVIVLVLTYLQRKFFARFDFSY
jgi:multiple sugar transport system permease protein